MKILFIDDDRYHNQGLVDYFRVVESWEVEFVETPRESLGAIDKFLQDATGKADPFDLILLDVMMPPDDSVQVPAEDLGQSTGLYLLDRLSELLQGKIPILLFTARLDIPEDRYAGKAAGYLRKSLTTAEIVETIRGTVRGLQPRGGVR